MEPDRMRVNELIGISNEKLDKMMKRFEEIIPKDKSYPGTAELIELIAKEKMFTRKELVYMGIVIAVTWESADI